MKVAIFSDNFYPEISGISDSVILLAKELVKLGHEVHFFAARYSASDFAKANLPQQEMDMGPNVKFHRFWSLPFLGSPTGQSRIVLPLGLRCLKYKKEKFDVIYTQSPYGMGMEALLMSRLLGVPLIGTNHTPITEFTSYLPLSNKLFDWLGLKFVSWYYNRCKFVTAPYAGILDEMKRYGLKRDSMELSNPIDLKNFISPTNEEKKLLKKKYALSEHVILYTGRIAPEKKVDVIINALLKVKKNFPDVMLAVTGIGNAEQDLKNLAKELGLEEAVKFFGRVDDRSHVELYQASEIFVVMSVAETQCISMMKAMSVGIPSIAADAWALPNYLGRDGKRGFVVPVGDAKTLAEKITFLLENPEQQKMLGENGKLFVSQFSASVIANKWEEIFAKNSKEIGDRKMKLSIVIPAYNEGKYVGICLASVMKEIEKSKREIEVIVVNNASTDDTKKVAESFVGVLVIDEFNKGLVRARSAGYKTSNGDIVANVDSDGWLPEGWIEKVFLEFEKDDNLVALSGPDIYPEMSKAFNFIVSAWYMVGMAGHFFNQYVLKRGAMLQGGNFVVRRSAMEKINGFDTSIEFYGEDTDVACRIQKVGKVKFTFKLPMYTSSRRFKGDGILITGIRYGINHIWTIFFKKPFSKSYNDFRSGDNI